MGRRKRAILTSAREQSSKSIDTYQKLGQNDVQRRIMPMKMLTLKSMGLMAAAQALAKFIRASYECY